MILICRVLDCWIDFRSCIEIVMLQELDVQPHRFDERRDYIASMVLHIDFFSKKKVNSLVLFFCRLFSFLVEWMR